MMGTPSQIQVGEFCRREGIRRLAVFGSRLSGNPRADSDLDLLVEFEPGTAAGLLTIARLERELGELLGARVDLRTEGDLSPYFRDAVTAAASPIFEAA